LPISVISITPPMTLAGPPFRSATSSPPFWHGFPILHYSDLFFNEHFLNKAPVPGRKKTP